MKSHKWAKEISHHVNGGAVECKYKIYDVWWPTPQEQLEVFNNDELEFRIKPSKSKVVVAMFRIPSIKRNRLMTYDDARTHPTECIRISDWVTIEYEEL